MGELREIDPAVAIFASARTVRTLAIAAGAEHTPPHPPLVSDRQSVSAIKGDAAGSHTVN